MRRILALVLLALTAPPAPAQDYDAGLAAFDAGDYASAAQEWSALAQTGDARARHDLRLMADSGLALPIPPAAAFALYRQGAARGVALSQINLALALWHGRGTPADQRLALTWALLAATPEAQRYAGDFSQRLPPKDRDAALVRAETCRRDGLAACLP